MSFLTDLFEGNFGNLGTDITHAPSSLAAHPTEIAELLGAAALPFGLAAGADLLGLGAGTLADVGTSGGLEGLAATEGAPAVADALSTVDPAILASAPELGGAEASLADIGGAVGAGEVPALADAFTAEQSLGLPEGGLPGMILNPSAGSGEAIPFASAAADLGGTSPEALQALGYAGDAGDLGGETLLPATTTDAGGASVPAIPTSAGSAGGGIASTVGNVLNSPITRAAELGLPLGMIGYNLLRGPPPLPSTATQAVGNVQGLTANVPALNQTVQQDLAAGNAYQLTPGMAASLETWRQNQYNALYQQLANSGIANPTQSSQWVQGRNQIDQQAEAQRGQMVQQLLATAFQAQTAATGVTSAANNTLLQAAQLQISQDNAFQQSISSALQSFGLMAALQGRSGTTSGTQRAAA